MSTQDFLQNKKKIKIKMLGCFTIKVSAQYQCDILIFYVDTQFMLNIEILSYLIATMQFMQLK